MDMDARQATNGQIIEWLRLIVRQQRKIIALLEEKEAEKTTGQFSAFRSRILSEFSTLAASNIVTWLWRIIGWLISAAGLGQVLVKLLGLHM